MRLYSLTFFVVAFIAQFDLKAQAWEEQDPQFPNRTTPYDVFVPTSTDAWVVGWELDSALVPTEINYTLSRTANGGQTWESLSFPHTEPGYLSCLSSLDGEVAWIAYVDYAEGNKVLKTTDGGQNWSLQPVVINSWINNVHFFNADVGFVLGDADSLGFEFYVTSNGGDSWERIDNSLIPVALADEYGYSGYYEVVGSEIWAETSIGRIFYSPDYGHTWSVISGPLSDVQSMVAVDDEKAIYIAYTMASQINATDPITRLFRSLNNGGAWQEITPADNAWWIYDIEPVPGTNTIIASFNRGFTTGIFETRISYNQGESWITIDTTGQILSLDFVDAQTGFAGRWRTPEDFTPSLVYKYEGSPLTALLDPKPIDLALRVSPNPTTDLIEIKVHSISPEDYWIIMNDMSGHLMAKYEFDSVSSIEKSIDLTAFPSGTYTLTIANKHGLRTEKVIKH